MTLIQKKKKSLLVGLFIARQSTGAVLQVDLDPVGNMKLIVGTVWLCLVQLGKAALWSAPLSTDQSHDSLDWRPIVGRSSKQINNTQFKAFSVDVKQNTSLSSFLRSNQIEDVQSSQIFCNATVPPRCVDKTFGFCLSDHDYPEDEMKVAMEFSELADKFAYKLTDISVDTEMEYERKKSSCPSISLLVKPLRLRNIYGHWRVIVQEASDIFQRERVVICTNPGEHCKIPEYFGHVYCYSSRCSQQYLVRELLAFDPCNPKHGVFVDSFNMQSACSCRFSRTTC
ncbi:hypothetical protein GHT06_021209 [Daphnia sinensis]|uniref:Spaetzle domain-containing protein n=1 Tax=Daphnia sinensis TaxID=1820382 RepID=A0AAD5KIT5_9CRUS|nr:hypothetical protein GHT06_021209 [Daphnia sinensis]